MADEQPILLLGASGQLGFELQRAMSKMGQVVALNRLAADLARPHTLKGVIRRFRPRVIINAAAYTAVDRAESEPDVAELVNGVAPRIVAEEAEAIGAQLVHYSTDYVFDGRKPTPYVESDAPNPLSVYGRSKLDGERAVAEHCRRYLTLRTSWVFGIHGSNFLKTILRLAAERDRLRVVADQSGAPTAAALIADVTERLLQALRDAPAADTRWGLYHLTASGETSWHAYALHIVRRSIGLGLPIRAIPDRIDPITSAEYPAPASRPANSRLSTAKLRDAFGIELPDWRCGVDEVLDQLKRHIAQ